MARTSLRWVSHGSPALVGTPAAPFNPTLLQSWVAAGSGAVEVTSQDVTLGSTATAGSLLLVAGNSDATITTPSGFTLARSSIANQATYLWYKIAAGGEQTVTLTPSATRPVAGAIGEYSVASYLLDVVANANRSSSSNVTALTGTTGATAQNVELIITVAGPHSFSAGTAPTAAGWTSATNKASVVTGFSTAGRNVGVFIGELVSVASGTKTDTCTWTNSSQNAGGIIATFKG